MTSVNNSTNERRILLNGGLSTNQTAKMEKELKEKLIKEYAQYDENYARQIQDMSSEELRSAFTNEYNAYEKKFQAEVQAQDNNTDSQQTSNEQGSIFDENENTTQQNTNTTSNDITLDESNRAIDEAADEQRASSLTSPNTGEDDTSASSDGILSRLASIFKNDNNNKTKDLTVSDIDGYKNKRSIKKAMYLDTDVMNIVDEDGDGKISDAEKEKFEYYIKSLGNNDKLELDDIKSTLKRIKEGKFDEDAYKKFDLDKAKEIEKAQKAEKGKQNADSTNALGAGGSGGGGGGGGASGIGASNPDNSKTLEQLKQEQAEKQGVYNNAKQAYEDVYNGKNEQVAAANEACKNAEDAYKEAMENESEEAKELESRRQEIQGEIDNKQSAINEANCKITMCQAEINSNNAQISACDSQISALESAKAACEATVQQASGAKDERSKNAAAEAQAQIAQIQEQIQSYQEQKAQLEEQNAAKTEEMQTAQESIQTAQEEMTSLQEQYAEIESELIPKLSEETAEMLQKFDEAREQVQMTIDYQAEAAKGNMDTAQSNLDKINKAVEQKEAEQTEKDNTVKLGLTKEDIQDFIKGLGNISSAELAKKMRAAGVSFDEGAFCGDFAYYVLKELMGEENLPAWMQATQDGGKSGVYYRSAYGWNAAGNHNGGNHFVKPDQAQPGDIVISDNDGFGVGTYPDHVMIFLGYNPQTGYVEVAEGNGPNGTVSISRMKYYDPSTVHIVSMTQT